MPRKHTIYQSEYPYHINARCINKEWFRVPIDTVWEIMSNYLWFLHQAFNFKIHAFVLMNNHYHLLATTPDENISDGMNYFQREVSREITRVAGRINQTWGSPYDSCVIASDRYFRNVYKYVYQNPVRAGLVRSALEYRYSTLHGLIGQSHLMIPVEDPILFDPDFNKYVLEWLCEEQENVESIRLGLKKARLQDSQSWLSTMKLPVEISRLIKPAK